MDQLVDLIKLLGAPAAITAAGAYVVIRYMMQRERRCDERYARLEEKHAMFVEEKTRVVTAALIENTASNRSVSDATRELTQALTGRHRSISQ